MSGVQKGIYVHLVLVFQEGVRSALLGHRNRDAALSGIVLIGSYPSRAAPPTGTGKFEPFDAIDRVT